MRHLNSGRKLNRTSSHRKALYRNLVASLFRHGRIVTTPAKAKEARSLAERLITIAKNAPDSLAARRRAIQLLHDPALVRSLFQDLALRYKERPGGYTRILHLSRTRVGDGAPQVIFELVEGGAPGRRAEQPKAVVADKPASGPAVEFAPVVESEPAVELALPGESAPAIESSSSVSDAASSDASAGPAAADGTEPASEPPAER